MLPIFSRKKDIHKLLETMEAIENLEKHEFSKFSKRYMLYIWIQLQFCLEMNFKMNTNFERVILISTMIILFLKNYYAVKWRVSWKRKCQNEVIGNRDAKKGNYGMNTESIQSGHCLEVQRQILTWMRGNIIVSEKNRVKSLYLWRKCFWKILLAMYIYTILMLLIINSKINFA